MNVRAFMHKGIHLYYHKHIHTCIQVYIQKYTFTNVHDACTHTDTRNVVLMYLFYRTHNLWCLVYLVHTA